jgi:hypothetical protein
MENSGVRRECQAERHACRNRADHIGCRSSKLGPYMRNQGRPVNTVLLGGVHVLSPPRVVALKRHWQHGCNFRVTVLGYSGLSRRYAWPA